MSFVDVDDEKMGADAPNTITLQNPQSYTTAQLEQMQHEVRRSIPVLSNHCLYFAAKWAAELLVSVDHQLDCLTVSQNENMQFDNDNDNKMNHINNSHIGNGMSNNANHDLNKSAKDFTAKDITLLNDKIALAKTYFDLKDFHRVAHILTDCVEYSKRAFFLSSYAKFFLGEKRKEEKLLEAPTKAEKNDIKNEEITGLFQDMTRYKKEHGLDSFGHFIFGIILREMERVTDARNAFVDSISLFPYNWSAWRSLAELVNHEKIYKEVKEKLPNHWMCQFFDAEVMVETTEFHEQWQVLNYFEVYASSLPQNPHILGQTALVLYNMRKFDDAAKMFESLLLIDPKRVELMDVYSNILFLKEQRRELSHLAHLCINFDKFRAETCCIIGNYYAMYGMHKKAILYFKRALLLNPKFVSVLTLMGHEYIELRNTPAAIQAYRMSVDANPNDYRGWYGLGQTYELLQMYSYAVFYYTKVCKMRPFDARMWNALGAVYEKLSRSEQAILCYKRALQLQMSSHGGRRRMLALTGANERDATDAANSANNTSDAKEENTEGKDGNEANGASGVRAEAASGNDWALIRLARLYDRIGNKQKAYDAYVKYINWMDENVMPRVVDDNVGTNGMNGVNGVNVAMGATGSATVTLTDEMIDALLYLSKSAFDADELEQSEAFANRVYNEAPHCRAKARKILDHVSMLKSQKESRFENEMIPRRSNNNNNNNNNGNDMGNERDSFDGETESRSGQDTDNSDDSDASMQIDE